MVNVTPMSTALRAIPKRWRPNHPPIFDGPPTRDDIVLAVELIEALDDESRAWYARSLESLRKSLVDA